MDLPNENKCSHLTLLLLVDALRPDYVRRTRFLKKLAAQSATGTLRECFGFVPRAAYFGGLTAEQYGFTNMYCCDPADSPFTMAKALPASTVGAAVEKQAGIRQLLEESARGRLAPFAKAYASSAEIPLRFLPFFALVEKRAPWDRYVGYESLFARLDRAGIPWHQCSWPETNKLADHSDDEIVRQVARELKPEHRFAYVHLQELDGVGHAYGPNSVELQKALARTDRCCEELIETLRSRYDSYNVVLFGDHGMVSITRTLDVGTALEATGLQFGIDYTFFLDSTMARFWFYHTRAREQVEAALAGLAGGRVLSQADLKHYRIAGCDRRNAELIFLADPGVLIFPNFFQRHGEPIKGMHGYDPDCRDNLGFFLLHCSKGGVEGSQSAIPSSIGRTGGVQNRFSFPPGACLGKIDPPMLFPLLECLVGLREPSDLPLAFQTVARGPRGRFTRHPEPGADEMVQGQLAQIVEEIERRFGRSQAIVLTGSFGRGEGGVFRDADGRYRPVNDYDLLVVNENNSGPELKKTGDELAAKLGIDFIDLGGSNGQWEHLPLTIQHYDLKYGSQVLAGDPNILDRIPDYASADIPVYEAVKLLLNRTAGLLSGLRGEFLAGAAPTLAQRRYLTNQIVKVLMAVGDWHLLRWEAYDSSYLLRSNRFQALAPGAGLAAELVSRIVEAYQFKCLPDYENWWSQDLRGAIPRSIVDHPRVVGIFPALELALIHSINLQTESHAKDLSGAMTVYVESMSTDEGWMAADNTLCAGKTEIKPTLKANPRLRYSLRHLVYAALPFVLESCCVPSRAEAALAEAVARLEPCFRAPAVRKFDPAGWEELRAWIVQAWFAICH